MCLRRHVQDFTETPESSGRDIARLGNQYGYSFVRPSLRILEDRCKGPSDARDVLTMLRQPEWLWVRTDDPKRLIFGIQRAGGFQPLGFYYVGSLETGDIHIFQAPVVCTEYTPAQDPRDKVTAPLKQKVFKRPSGYYLVDVGRIVDLLRKGYARTAIVLTGFPKKLRYLVPGAQEDNQPQLKLFPAYVVLDGPCATEEQLKQAN